MSPTFSRSFVAAALLSALAASSAFGADSARRVLSFDNDWRFLEGDATGAEVPAFADAEWKKVNVPHDYAIDNGFNQNSPTKGAGAFIPVGNAWYRKDLTLAAADVGKKVFIDFDGVMANSDVWINGQHLGKRPSGYVSFQYDLTPHLHFDGKPNIVAVRCDNAKQPASRWYAGAGIYRHVRVTLTDPLHLENWGTFVTTPKVSAQASTVHVKSTVVNQGTAPRTVSLLVTLLAPDGNPVGSAETAPVAVAPGKSADLEQDVAIASTQLWDISSPSMYKAVATVREKGAEVDEEPIPFGIRQFEFKADSGFWLNGQNMKIKGVCLHAEAGALGMAVPKDEWIQRLKILKQFGANGVRPSHNTFSPEFLDACDEVGFVVMSELFDCWTVAKNPYDFHLYFKEWSLVDTRDTVRRDRNHPSIVIYSAGNEIRDTPQAETAKASLTGLVKTYHENDPTRPVTQALFRPNTSHDYENGLADILDVVGTNYRDAEVIKAHADKPSRKIIGTENGKELRSWAAVRDTPAYAGHFIWTGIDYLGESPKWPGTGNPAGILDITNRPKADAYERASWWSTTPMVAFVRAGGQIATGNANPDEPQERFTATVDWTPANLQPHNEDVQVFSNCDEVELFLNDKSLGSKPRGAVDSVRKFSVPFAPGTLKAVGKNKGQPVAHFELTTAGKAAKIVLKSSADKLFHDFDSMAHITATITDDKGIQVPGANNNLTFTLAGPGTLTALSTGNMTPQTFRGTTHFAYMGECTAYVHASAPQGKITLTVSAEGLTPATLTLDAAPASTTP